MDRRHQPIRWVLSPAREGRNPSIRGGLRVGTTPPASWHDGRAIARPRREIPWGLRELFSIFRGTTKVQIILGVTNKMWEFFEHTLATFLPHFCQGRDVLPWLFACVFFGVNFLFLVFLFTSRS